MLCLTSSVLYYCISAMTFGSYSDTYLSHNILHESTVQILAAAIHIDNSVPGMPYLDLVSHPQNLESTCFVESYYFGPRDHCDTIIFNNKWCMETMPSCLSAFYYAMLLQYSSTSQWS